VPVSSTVPTRSHAASPGRGAAPQRRTVAPHDDTVSVSRGLALALGLGVVLAVLLLLLTARREPGVRRRWPAGGGRGGLGAHSSSAGGGVAQSGGDGRWAAACTRVRASCLVLAGRLLVDVDDGRRGLGGRAGGPVAGLASCGFQNECFCGG